MPQDGGTSNRKENKREASKELNARLPEYSPDQALLLTARSPIHVGMPPLTSYIRQQFSHLGESSRRLTGWVTGHGSLASTVSRAIRLPLLSTAFDYILRKTTFVSPVWQRMLDLPWVRQHRRRRRDSNQAPGITIDGRLNKASPQQSEIYPDVLLQPLSDIQGEHADSEASETYTLAVDETYPSIISPNLLSPSVTRRELLTTTDDLPHATSDTTWPLHTRKIADRQYPSVPGKPSHVTTKEKPLRAGDEVYPSVTKTKDAFSAPVSMEKAPGTTSLTPGTKAMTGRRYLRRSSQPSPITSGEAPVRSGDDVYPSVTKEVLSAPVSIEKAPGTTFLTPVTKPMTGRRHLSRSSQPSPITSGEAPVRSGDDVYPSVTKPISKKQPLSRAVTEVQPPALQSKPVKGRSHTTRREIDGTHVFPQRKLLEPKTVESKVESDSTITKQSLPYVLPTIPKIRASHQPDSEYANTPPTLAKSRQPDTLEHRSQLNASLGRSVPTIPGDTLKRLSPSIISRTVRHFNEMISNTLLPEVLTYSESPAVLPERVSHQWAPQVGQTRRQKPADEQASAISQAEGMTDISQKSDTLYPISLEHGSIGRSSMKVRVNKPLLYREPLSFVSPPVPEPPVPEIADHAMTLPYQQLFRARAYAPLSDRGESYRFLKNQEYVTSSPGYKYTGQPRLNLSAVPSIQPEADLSQPGAQELFTNIYNTTPAYSRNQNAPELALAPVRRAMETPSQPTLQEKQGEGGSEKVVEPDIDMIAQNVYRVLRRRLVRERERALGY